MPRLMSGEKSHFIDPLRFAHSKQRLEGSLQLRLMKRLQRLQDDGDTLHYRLLFDVDMAGFCSIESEIWVSVILQCQRCLKPSRFDIHKRNLLGVVNNQTEMAQLDSSYEPLLLEDGRLLLNEFIEDELLLALPVYPLHQRQECSGQTVLERINAESKPTPFAILESLKKNNH